MNNMNNNISGNNNNMNSNFEEAPIMNSGKS